MFVLQGIYPNGDPNGWAVLAILAADSPELLENYWNEIPITREHKGFKFRKWPIQRGVHPKAEMYTWGEQDYVEFYDYEIQHVCHGTVLED